MSSVDSAPELRTSGFLLKKRRAAPQPQPPQPPPSSSSASSSSSSSASSSSMSPLAAPAEEQWRRFYFELREFDLVYFSEADGRAMLAAAASAPAPASAEGSASAGERPCGQQACTPHARETRRVCAKDLNQQLPPWPPGLPAPAGAYTAAQHARGPAAAQARQHSSAVAAWTTAPSVPAA